MVRRITWRTADVVRLLGLVVLFIFLWTFFWRVYTALFVALIAVLLAIVLHAPARFLSRWIPFRLAFALVLAAFIAALAGLFVRLIPELIDQASALVTQLPTALETVSDYVESKTGRQGNDQISQSINRQLADFVGRFVPLAFNLISTVFGSFAIVILAVFMAVQPDVYRALLVRMARPQSRADVARIYDEAGRNLRNWVIGKVLTMIFVGVATYIGLTLLDVPGALALSFLAALLEFIPTFGPTIAAAPAVVTAFSISPSTAFYVAAFYFLLQQVQNGITVPLVERKAVDIPPAVLLIWQLMLAVGFGILGLFVATPLLAVIVVAVRVMYLEPVEEMDALNRREAAQPTAEESPGAE